MQAHSSVDDESIGKIYEDLKALLQDGHTKEARLFLDTFDFSGNWDQLLHHSMLKRNCPVSKLIVIQVAQRRLLTKEQIQMRVSQVDHEIQKDFMNRLGDYIKSAEFDQKLEEYQNVRQTVGHHLKTNLGVPLLNPNAF